MCDNSGPSTCWSFSSPNTVYDVADDGPPSARPLSGPRIRHTAPSKAANAASRPALKEPQCSFHLAPRRLDIHSSPTAIPSHTAFLYSKSILTPLTNGGTDVIVGFCLASATQKCHVGTPAFARGENIGDTAPEDGESGILHVQFACEHFWMFSLVRELCRTFEPLSAARRTGEAGSGARKGARAMG